MKSNMRAGISVDTGSGNNRSAKVTPDVLGDNRRITVIGFGVDIKTFAVISVNGRFNFLKRRAEFRVKPVEKGSTESFSEKFIVKMLNAFPRRNASDGDFRN